MQSKYRVRVLLGIVVACAGAPSFALNPNQHISQYGHSVWRMQDGMFPGDPFSVTQTADGYLWVGTQTGLVRFDGARFVPWAPSRDTGIGETIVSLLGARDGSLWIGSNGGVAHQKGEAYMSWPLGRINAIVEDSSGAVWVARSRIPPADHRGPLCRMTAGEWRCFGEAEGVRFRRDGAEALIDDDKGGLWIGSVKSVGHWSAGAATVFPLKSLGHAEGAAGIQALALDRDGALLVGAGQNGAGAGLQKLSSNMWGEYRLGSIRGSSLSVSAILRDRDGAIWIATSDNGLVHFHNGSMDVFNAADGLSGDSVQGLCEDREGDIWAVSSRGLDRFRELPVVAIGKREGLSGEHVTSVFASPERIWLGNGTSVDFIRNDRVLSLRPELLPGKTTTSILEDHLGQLWLGMDAGLSVMTGGRFFPIRTSEGKPLGVVFGLAEGIGNHVYAEVTGRPQRIYDIQNREVVAAVDIPKAVQSSAFEADPAGGIWLLAADETLMHYQSGKFDVVGHPGTCVSCARALFHGPGNVLWAAGKGVARWTGSNWQTLSVKDGLTCDQISSAIFDDHGTLWLAADCGLMSVDSANLRRWVDQHDARISVHTYDVVDGAQTGHSPFQPTVSKSPDGRLWFANENVLQVVDPSHTSENRVPPPVLIETVVADGTNYRPGGVLQIPPRTRSLRIDYTALSLVTPQKVRFRYILAGGSGGWQNAGTRRQAFYNDLPPGKYRFHVIACNNSGLWNEAGASLEFSVLPAYYQTTWFRLACALAGIIILWILYRIRLRQVADKMNARFDERMAERNRLAGELHDTILQTVQATKMIADNARLDHSAHPVRLRETLERVSEWLSRATVEARVALNSLRESTSQRNDLAEALQGCAEASQMMAPLKFVQSVEGTARDLHPIVRDEIYRIGCEAIRNAVRHSGATEIRSALTYGQDLVLRISDNGRGMASDVVTQGLPGHFGIRGMYERASRIHGTLRLRSRINAGTELELHVRGNVVYSHGRTIREPG